MIVKREFFTNGCVQTDNCGILLVTYEIEVDSMKRILSIFLLLCLLLTAFAGCGGIDAEYADDPEFQTCKQYARDYFELLYGEDDANYEFEFMDYWYDEFGTKYHIFEVTNVMFICCWIATNPDGEAYLDTDCDGEGFEPVEQTL